MSDKEGVGCCEAADEEVGEVAATGEVTAGPDDPRRSRLEAMLVSLGHAESAEVAREFVGELLQGGGGGDAECLWAALQREEADAQAAAAEAEVQWRQREGKGEGEGDEEGEGGLEARGATRTASTEANGLLAELDDIPDVKKAVLDSSMHEQLDLLTTAEAELTSLYQQLSADLDSLTAILDYEKQFHSRLEEVSNSRVCTGGSGSPLSQAIHNFECSKHNLSEQISGVIADLSNLQQFVFGRATDLSLPSCSVLQLERTVTGTLHEASQCITSVYAVTKEKRCSCVNYQCLQSRLEQSYEHYAKSAIMQSHHSAYIESVKLNGNCEPPSDLELSRIKQSIEQTRSELNSLLSHINKIAVSNAATLIFPLIQATKETEIQTTTEVSDTLSELLSKQHMQFARLLLTRALISKQTQLTNGVIDLSSVLTKELSGAQEILFPQIGSSERLTVTTNPSPEAAAKLSTLKAILFGNNQNTTKSIAEMSTALVNSAQVHNSNAEALSKPNSNTELLVHLRHKLLSTLSPNITSSMNIPHQGSTPSLTPVELSKPVADTSKVLQSLANLLHELTPYS